MALLVLILVLIIARFGVMRLGNVVENNLRKNVTTKQVPQQQLPQNNGARPDEPLIGEEILKGYADPATLPQEDVIRLAHALDNFSLLVKGESPLPFGSNEELAAALLGKNRAQLRFLSATHPALNSQGQLVDRWSTPLFFHAVSRDRLDIRSAGPDKVMWTEDDLHRRHNGQFLRGEELKTESLYSPAAPGRSRPLSRSRGIRSSRASSSPRR